MADLQDRRVFELSAKEFRLLIREAVAWGVLMALTLAGLLAGMALLLVYLIQVVR